MMLITTCMKMKQCVYQVASRLAAMVLFLAATSPAAAQVASFQGLGDLPGGSLSFFVNGVSADGTVVVGSSRSVSGEEAFRWTSGSGMVGMGDLPGGSFSSKARGVSADGSVVVGYGNSTSGTEAYRWTAGGGMVGMGDLPGGRRRSLAQGVSFNGSVVVGLSDAPAGGQAFRWTSDGGMVGLGYLVGGDFDFSAAQAVSGDGSVVVGYGKSASSAGGTEAFRWTSGDGMVGLGDLPGGFFRGLARGVSGDGSVVVGSSTSALGQEAFRWEGGVMVGLGYLNASHSRSIAYGVSADGTVVVGESNFVAFVWDATNGMRSLKQVLEDDAGLDLTGWRLSSASGVSADGLVIVGIGRNPNGQFEGYRAQLGLANHGPLVTCPAPVAAECSETGGATIDLVADVFDEDGDSLDITWHITAPDGSVTTVSDAVEFGNPPSPVEVMLSRLFPLGLSEVSITVDDGIVSTDCPSPILVCVEDTVAPIVATLQELVSVGTDVGECFATPDFDPVNSPFAPLFSDVCSPDATATNNAPESFLVGETVVTWTIFDGNGNFIDVTQTVVVTDGEAPDILAPADFAVVHDPGVCVATILSLGSPIASDNCEVVDIFNDAPDVFGLGETEVTWYAVDAEHNVMTATQVVTVTNADPIADAGADRILECDSPQGLAVTLNGSASYDPDPGDMLVLQWSASKANGDPIVFDDDGSPTPTATFPLGSTTVTLTVTDVCGAMSSTDVIITVEDTNAPAIDAVITDRNILQVPNHKLVSVAVRMLVRDTCEFPELLNVLCTASSNEPDDGTGDGSFTGDVNGQDGYTNDVLVSMTFNVDTGYWEGIVLLRSERDGAEDGRKYSLVCTAADAAGNISTATVCVVVPHDRRGKK